MFKRSIIIYWLLMLAPACAIGVMMLRLVKHEEARLRQAALTASENKVGNVIENIQLAVEEVENTLMENLLKIETPDLEPALELLESENPLVRNVFLQDENGALMLPPEDSPHNREERVFLERYDALLSGREPWQESTESIQAVASAPKIEARSFAFNPVRQGRQSTQQSDYQTLVPEDEAQQAGGYWQSRKGLKDLAQGYGQYINEPAQQKEIMGERLSGWIPWYSENKLHTIGWVKDSMQGMIYGVELEMVTLLSRLISFIPQGETPTESYALIDGGGKIFYQSGAVGPGAEPLIQKPVGPDLPHWQVAVFAPRRNAGEGAGLLTMLYSSLVGIFILAIAVGGFLLLWQAHKNLREAHQKTSFVSNVSHELKTPLTTIRMYAELIGEGRVKNEDKKKKYMKVIIDESQRLTRLVNNVLDFGRLEENQKKYHLEQLDLGELVRSVLETQRVRSEEAGVELAFEPPEGPMPVVSDRDAVEQTLLNLVDNSLKYARDGKRIRVSVEKNASHCHIHVMDEGPGIPESQQEKIFEKFHRIDDSLTAKTQGSGLGLSIARRLMRGLGGDLKVEHRSEGGARFAISVPIAGTGTPNGHAAKGAT